MGTAAWGGWGEGKCFHCNGLSWCGCHLQCPSLLHQTAVPPKLLGVLIIRLCGRTAQPSATPASPHVSMRGIINPALHSASPKETSRWCVATQPRVPVLSSALRSSNQSVAQMEKPTAMNAIFKWLLVLPLHQSHKPMRASVQNVLLNSLSLEMPAPYLKLLNVLMERSAAVDSATLT